MHQLLTIILPNFFNKKYVLITLKTLKILTFLTTTIYLYKNKFEMENKINSTGKRQYRNMSPQQKQKLSVAHQGKKHKESTKRLISQKLQQYWSELSYAPTTPPTTNNNNSGNTLTNYGQ